jgi:ABC-type polysaccharide/polyol phosphate export permease
MKKYLFFFRLSWAIAKAEFKLKNEGSYIGIFWYLLNPLLSFLLLFVVFFDRLGNTIPDYPLYLLLGIVIFNFFQQITTEATGVISGNVGIIKSIKFPHEALIGAVVLKIFFSHIFEIVVLVLFLFFFKIPAANIILYPIILCFLSIFVFGAALILSSLTIYFIDLTNIWAFVSRLIWLGTPIFYAIGGQKRLFFINLFNPMYYFITIARETIIYARVPELWLILGAIGYSFLALLAGLVIFNKLKTRFAEMM